MNAQPFWWDVKGLSHFHLIQNIIMQGRTLLSRDGEVEMLLPSCAFIPYDVILPFKMALKKFALCNEQRQQC